MAKTTPIDVRVTELDAVDDALVGARKAVALLRALTADEWAGWGMDEDRGEFECFYCHAYTKDQDNGYAHKPDCPLAGARVLLGTQPDVATQEA